MTTTDTPRTDAADGLLAQIEAMLALCEAATPGPWPCWHCCRTVDSKPSTIRHAEECAGIALRDALAAVTGGSE